MDKILFSSAVATVGSFELQPHDIDFSFQDCINQPIFVFPQRNIWIEHDGNKPYVADTSQINFYNKEIREKHLSMCQSTVYLTKKLG